MLEIHPEDKDRMREFQHNHRSYGTILINLVFLMGLAAAGAYFGHPEWFGDHRWQSTETPSEGGPADNEFETLYTTYAIPPLRQATAASQEVHPYLVTLSKEPCNKTAIYQLTINLEKKIDLRSTATILQGYANTCPDAAGEQYRAAELLYLSGDYLASIKIATQVLAIQPSASYAFYLRGRALQNQRRFEQALQDYTATIQLTPDGKKISSEVFMRMSQSYEALNKYCEAITPIQLYIAYDPETRSSLPLETKISELSKRGNCPAQAKGQARFPRRNSGTLSLSAEINGIPGNFIIDTGATFVTLSKAFAAKAQVVPVRAASVELTTANGVIAGTLATAKTVRLTSVSAKTVPVVIIDKPGGADVDGLLGMSFLSRFSVSMTATEFVIQDKSPK